MGGLDSFVKVGQKFLPSPGVLFITHLVRILIHFLGGPLVKALPIRVRPCKLGSLGQPNICKQKQEHMQTPRLDKNIHLNTN